MASNADPQSSLTSEEAPIVIRAYRRLKHLPAEERLQLRRQYYREYRKRNMERVRKAQREYQRRRRAKQRKAKTEALDSGVAHSHQSEAGSNANSASAEDSALSSSSDTGSGCSVFLCCAACGQISLGLGSVFLWCATCGQIKS